MAKPIIPIRPSAPVSGLKPEEMSGLTWYILSGCSRKDAVLLFIRPDMVASKSKPVFEEYVKEFFSRKEVREYLDAYQQTMDAVLHPSAVKEKPVGSLEERKSKAKLKLVEFAMSLADNIEQAEDPEFVLKMADKAGLLDGDEQVEIVPQRFLGVRCSECAYRKFVEENCEEVPDGTEVVEENKNE